eukprot:GAHX01000157.1.p1 GENE.GAHX01000157.1~~GAHX01000157.1.p1  ORF type:complete len:458 (+),score=84.41 GAHX01000157.1:45-1376(+)
MTIDINLLRCEKGNDPEVVRKSEKDRFKNPDVVDETIKVDNEYLEKLTETNELRKKLNLLKKELTKIYKTKGDPNDMLKEKAEVEEKLVTVESLRDSLFTDLQAKLKSIGNVITSNVPVGEDDDSNTVIRTWRPEPSASIGELEVSPKLFRHDELMKKLDGLETHTGTLIAGHRGYFLKNSCLLLAQALQQYALSLLIKSDYTPIQPPYFMNYEYIMKTCQISDLEENLYCMKSKADNDPNEKVLIATSEQPISCLYTGQKLEAQVLPLRFAGVSACFRKEAGSHGKDIKGIFRVHQFEKVEQFIYCHPEKSVEEHQKMVTISEEFLKSLEIPFQSVYIASGELNDAAAEKVDIEGWFPTQGKFRELMSCSNCTDYQSREVNVKYVENNKKEYVHLLNGTLCAVQRTLCCVLENHQTKEGIKIPEVLKRFYLGKERDVIKFVN